MVVNKTVQWIKFRILAFNSSVKWLVFWNQVTVNTILNYIHLCSNTANLWKIMIYFQWNNLVKKICPHFSFCLEFIEKCCDHNLVNVLLVIIISNGNYIYQHAITKQTYNIVPKWKEKASLFVITYVNPNPNLNARLAY